MARTPLQLADRAALSLKRVSGMLEQRGMPPGGGGAPPAGAPPAASETREQARAAVEAGFEALIAAVDGLTAADLEVTVPAPWGAQLTIAEWLCFLISATGYAQGQLNYVQLASGAEDANIPPDWRPQAS